MRVQPRCVSEILQWSATMPRSIEPDPEVPGTGSSARQGYQQPTQYMCLCRRARATTSSLSGACPQQHKPVHACMRVAMQTLNRCYRCDIGTSCMICDEELSRQVSKHCLAAVKNGGWFVGCDFVGEHLFSPPKVWQGAAAPCTPCCPRLLNF